MGHYFGWVEVVGALFWVGGGRWDIIWGGWGWVGMSGGGCLIMPNSKLILKKFQFLC